MNAFIKENITLILALALPIVFAGFFYISKTVTTPRVDPPAHDFLIIADRYDQFYDIKVINNKLSVKFIYPVRDNKDNFRNVPTETPEIFYVDAKTLSAEPINFSIPDDARNPPPEKEGIAVDIPLPRTQNLTMSGALISPDGFTFEQGSYRDGNIMTEIYESRSRRYNEWSLQKENSSFEVKGLTGYNFSVLGWVTGNE